MLSSLLYRIYLSKRSILIKHWKMKLVYYPSFYLVDIWIFIMCILCIFLFLYLLFKVVPFVTCNLCIIYVFAFLFQAVLLCFCTTLKYVFLKIHVFYNYIFILSIGGYIHGCIFLFLSKLCSFKCFMNISKEYLIYRFIAMF